MTNLRSSAETLTSIMFHAMWAEILYGQVFEKNLQQILIRAAKFNYFPQILNKPP